jgi:iron-sulfur cluster assembly accessory protein
MNDLNMTITPAADKFVRRLLRFDGGPMSGLRLSVTPDGSSGLSSQFAVADELDKGETVFEANGLRFFLLAESRSLLQGVTMDFQETATTAGFKFHEPHKTSTSATHNHDAPNSSEHVHEH